MATFAVAGTPAHANTVTPSCTLLNLTQVDCSAWHSGPVTLRWNWTPGGETGTSGCDTKTLSAETPPSGMSVTCTVSWGPASAAWTATLFIDNTPPTVTSATPARPPDHDGWYNHPVAFTFHGTDTPSGIASCDTVTYAGPDGAAALVTGGCTDLAGNRGILSVPLEYDATAPAPARVQETPGNGTIRLSWVAPADATSVLVARLRGRAASAPKTIYRGHGDQVTDRRLRNGHRYRYTVTVFDQAGNSTATRVSGVPTASTLRPLSGAIVSGPPRLSWRAARGASYYNLQLLKAGRKILSTWPRGPHLRLPRVWKYLGKRHRLGPGLYHWYVWPGYGARAEHRYGGRLGGSSFRVRV